MTLTAPPKPTTPTPRPADIMPPLLLPGEHFAAALAWLAVGSVGLIWIAPDLARGAFLTPRVVAVTHCFTLGWITTSIFGALYQLYPVVLGVPAKSIRVAHWTFWVLMLGTALLVGGAWFWSAWALAAGWVVMFAAVGGQSWNILGQRRRATRGRLIGLYVSGGHIGLGLAMAVVAARIGAELGWWSVGRLGVLNAHVHLAVVGFATLTAIGVGSKLFPMFLLSRDYRDRSLRWIGPLVLGGLVVSSSGALGNVRWLLQVGGLATAAGIVLYLRLAWEYFRTRTKPRLDPGLAHAAAALVFLALATSLGAVLLFAPSLNARTITAYATIGILGWLMLLIVGMYYKILPFLTWLHRFSPRVGKPGLPKVTDLISPRLAWSTLPLLAGGVAVLAVAVYAGSPVAAAAGAASIAAGVFLVVIQHVRLVTMERER